MANRNTNGLDTKPLILATIPAKNLPMALRLQYSNSELPIYLSYTGNRYVEFTNAKTGKTERWDVNFNKDGYIRLAPTSKALNSYNDMAIGTWSSTDKDFLSSTSAITKVASKIPVAGTPFLLSETKDMLTSKGSRLPKDIKIEPLIDGNIAKTEMAKKAANTQQSDPSNTSKHRQLGLLAASANTPTKPPSKDLQEAVNAQMAEAYGGNKGDSTTKPLTDKYPTPDIPSPNETNIQVKTDEELQQPIQPAIAKPFDDNRMYKQRDVKGVEPISGKALNEMFESGKLPSGTKDGKKGYFTADNEFITENTYKNAMEAKDEVLFGNDVNQRLATARESAKKSGDWSEVGKIQDEIADRRHTISQKAKLADMQAAGIITPDMVKSSGSHNLPQGVNLPKSTPTTYVEGQGLRYANAAVAPTTNSTFTANANKAFPERKNNFNLNTELAMTDRSSFNPYAVTDKPVGLAGLYNPELVAEPTYGLGGYHVPRGLEKKPTFYTPNDDGTVSMNKTFPPSTKIPNPNGDYSVDEYGSGGTGTIRASAAYSRDPNFSYLNPDEKKGSSAFSYLNLSDEHKSMANQARDSIMGDYDSNPFDIYQDKNTTIGGAGGGAAPVNWAQGLGAVSQGIGAVAGLVGAYTGYRNLKQQEEQFDFTKDLANRNLANNAKLINNQIAANANAASYSGLTGSMSQADAANHRSSVMTAAEKKKVDGSSI